MKRLTRISAAVASSAFLVAGVAGVASANPAIKGNGNDSAGRIVQTAVVKSRTHNDALVGVQNNNPQTAWSGSAWSHDNRTGGNVTSGSASNTSTSAASVAVDYSGSNAAAAGAGAGSDSSDMSSPTISNNGNDSSNTVRQDTYVSNSVSNDSAVFVQNNNRQTAVSGSASSSDNRTGGSVTTGNATNTSTSTASVSVKY